MVYSLSANCSSKCHGSAVFPQAIGKPKKNRLFNSYRGKELDSTRQSDARYIFERVGRLRSTLYKASQDEYGQTECGSILRKKAVMPFLDLVVKPRQRYVCTH